jgi:hypothetical protein
VIYCPRCGEPLSMAANGDMTCPASGMQLSNAMVGLLRETRNRQTNNASRLNNQDRRPVALSGGRKAMAGGGVFPASRRVTRRESACYLVGVVRPTVALQGVRTPLGPAHAAIGTRVTRSVAAGRTSSRFWASATARC